MTWRPILQEDEAARAWRAIRAIARELAPAAEPGPDPSLQSGHAGAALFFHYLELAEGRTPSDSLRHLDWAIEAVADRPMGPSLFGGFTGIAWAAEHLQPNDGRDGEDTNRGIDGTLLELLDRGPWQTDYDLILGPTGFGVYALSRLQWPTAVACVEKVLARLVETAEVDGQGARWRTHARMQYAGQVSPEDHYNLGVAHGIPGVLAFLAHACLAGLGGKPARTLLREGVRWLWSQRLPEGGPARFGYCVACEGPSPRKPAALGWCYGDLGLAPVLLSASRALQDPALAEQALGLAKAAARAPRPEDREPGLCHGAAGIGHILHRLHRESGDPELREAARSWLLRALELEGPEGGFRSGRIAPDGRRDWVRDPGLLSGSAGVGLALLAAVSPVAPAWDRFMLLSDPWPPAAPGGPVPRPEDRLRLESLVQSHFQQLEATPYEALRESQPAPWACLTDGVSGAAYTLWHAGRARRDQGRLRQADAWFAEAERASRSRSAFHWPGLPGDQGLRASLHSSADGLRYVRLLAAHAQGLPVARSDAFKRFLARCRRKRGERTELMFGIAGYLDAATALLRLTGARGARETADLLAEDLLARARPGDPGSWTRDPCLGFAHGRAGTFHALLNWSHRTGRDLPGWFHPELRILADEVEAGGTMGAPAQVPASMRRSWCKGAAGLALLWAKAFEQSGDASYRRLAREAGAYAATGVEHAPATLCCGLAGRAYALLALDRVDPGAGWYTQALQLGIHAISQAPTLSQDRARGLYRGTSALICLAQDLLAAPADRAGFPLVED